MTKKVIMMSALSLLLLGCQNKIAEKSAANGSLELANPASVYCEKNGGRVENRKDAQGNETGICVFPNGSECDEWKFFRNECTSSAE
ncbi:DUF333 domain-containing protein [Candidatus Parcubacteria bacterium]|nr:MAG: DUF333 domain-containing protein [Candidatus Parcubacteria bacterium]